MIKTIQNSSLFIILIDFIVLFHHISQQHMTLHDICHHFARKTAVPHHPHHARETKNGLGWLMIVHVITFIKHMVPMVVPIIPGPGAEHLGSPGLSSYPGGGRGPGARAAPGAAPGHQLPLGGGPPAGGVAKLPS